MKKFSILICTLLIFCSAVSVEAAKKVIAVIPLDYVSGSNTKESSEKLTDQIITVLQNSGRYTVVDYTQMTSILRAQGFQNLAVNPDTAVEVGKLIGANYMLVGKVTSATIEKNIPVDAGRKILGKILPIDSSYTNGMVPDKKGEVSAEIRFINIETGEVTFAKSISGSGTDNDDRQALDKACKDCADNFLDEIIANLSGRVAEISGNDIYIDIGTESGLRKGMTLSIERETEPIIINTKIVGMKTIKIGKAKVTEVNAEYSICKIISTEKGKTVQKGDVVKKVK